MKRALLFAIFGILGAAWPGFAQTAMTRVPDCVMGITPITAVGTSTIYDNRGAGCVDWTLTYTTFGFSAATIQVDDAPNNNSTPGALVSFQGTILGGVTQPVAAASSGTYSMTGYYPFMAVAMTAKTGTGSFQGTLYGWRRDATSVTSIINPVQNTPNATYPTAFGIAVTNLSTTSGTVATASTVLMGTLVCINSSTSTAVAVNATNTAGNPLQGVAFSIPASSDKVMNFESGMLAVGIKWWASTATAWCSVTGWQ